MRQTRRAAWRESLAGDCRHAARSLLRAPAFSIAAILTIALGIGANTAVFSVLERVLLDPLPYRDPAQLVHIAETHPDFPSFQVAAPDFFDWQRTAASFEGIAAYTFQAVNVWAILGDGDPEPIHVVQASSSLFGLLGARPLLGRTYTVAEEVAKAPVVVIGESLWRRKYHADPGIVGRRIRLVDWPVTVIGVAGRHSAEPAWADVWMPLTFLDPALTESRRFRALEVIGRLKRGVTVERAQAEMDGIATGMAKAFSDTNGRVGASVIAFTTWTTGEARPALLICWAAASLVLLLACGNVAHLVLVRMDHRARESATRAALGAGPMRLLRLPLLENLFVAAAAGLLGALLAFFVLPLLSRLAADHFPRADSISLSPAVLAFAGCATVFCALIFALPALLRSRTLDLQRAIQQSGGSSLNHRRSWFGGSIIAAEIALAYMVIAGAGLLYRSFELLLDQDAGFDSRGVLAAEIPLALNWNQSVQVFEQRVAPALRSIPGVAAVAAVNCAPMSLQPSEVSRYTIRFGIEGRTFGPASAPFAQIRWTTPEYFRVLRIPLRRGRLFTSGDIGKKGYLINETLARRFLPNSDPIGQRIIYNVNGPHPESIPILGVVGDVRDLGFEREPAPTLYSLSVSNRMTVLLRGDVKPVSLIPVVRRALRKASPDAPVTVLAPLDELLQDSLALRRFSLKLVLVFAILAALLTAVGVYGVVSYTLSRRTREFAIRLALGAEPREIRSLILRDFAAPAFLGLLGGCWLAYSFGRVLRSQLYRLSPADPLVLGACALALVSLAILCALRPAAKAASVSPAAILRE